MTPAELQRAITQSTEATTRVLNYLDDQGEQHSGQISGATLAAVCGVDSRTWRRWVGDDRVPETAWRLLELVAGFAELPEYNEDREHARAAGRLDAQEWRPCRTSSFRREYDDDYLAAYEAGIAGRGTDVDPER